MMVMYALAVARLGFAESVGSVDGIAARAVQNCAGVVSADAVVVDVGGTAASAVVSTAVAVVIIFGLRGIQQSFCGWRHDWS
ncbi:MAG: hypothetical protein ACYC1I_12220 [Acidimicrobiales bacterium]